MPVVIMRRPFLLAAAAAVCAALAGCNQAQEDRAAQQAANAIHKGNQALKDITATAKEGAEKAAAAAREASKDAAPILSDAAVTAKVKAALLADKDVGGMAIDVDTQGGVVTLTGKTSSPTEASRAVEIARAVEGVKSVENRLSAQAG
jgi:osmotically-inducible protein OsmY